MITTMEGVTVYNARKAYKVGISANKIEPIEDGELDSLQNEMEGFWNVEKIEKTKDMYYIHYEAPDKARSFYNAKSGNEIMKLALLYNFMKNRFDEKSHTIIHPQNIFFTSLTEISMMYRDNGSLVHEEKIPMVEQYKALCICMLCRYSFEKLKDNAQRKMILEKLKNNFLNSIERCKDIEDIIELIYNRYIRLESDYFIFLDKDEKTARNTKLRNNIISTVFIVITCIMIITYIVLRSGI